MDGCKQLSLENLYLNRTATIKSPAIAGPPPMLHLKQQAIKILEVLKHRSVTTMELRSMACQYNARIRELRDYLRRRGETIDCIPQAGGNNLYKIVPFHGSRYQAELLRKSAKRRSTGAQGQRA